MELREALAQIHEIRQQVAQTEVFRGYRSATVGLTGGIAIIVAMIQAAFLPDPMNNSTLYVAIWACTAFICMALTGVEMIWRCRRSQSAYGMVTTTLAVGQFFPSVVAGGLFTITIMFFAVESVWLLPGLWCIFFSLGIFASYRLLPRAIFWVGAFYLLAGLVCIAGGQGLAALSPWLMGFPFGIGQFMAAAILYWTLERSHDEPDFQNE